jgi:hypothetical protein
MEVANVVLLGTAGFGALTLMSGILILARRAR